MLNIIAIAVCVCLCVISAEEDFSCHSPDGEKMQDAEVYRKEPSVFQCQKSKLVQIACYQKGTTYAPTQTWNDGVVYFSCEPTSDGNFEIKSMGCIHLPSKRVPIGETAQVKEYLFKCIRGEDKMPKFIPYSCLFKNKPLLVGETDQDDLYWYECKIVQKNGIVLEIKGCVNDLMRLNDGEIFYYNNFIYRCVNAGTMIKRLGVGCIEKTAQNNIIEHAIGDKWVEGIDKVQCIFNGLTVVKKSTK